ncbi:MAG: transglutaminase-like domain-containing protein [Candidatus Binataceae bacterium]
MENPLDYYTGNGPMTAPGAHAADVAGLPADIGALCEIIQGVLIHRDIAPFLYDLKLSSERYLEGNLRPMRSILARIHSLDDRPLTVARDPGHRTAVVCRHFALMLSAILRAQGVPARARCGFGGYFTAGKFEDHWVCEYWNAAQSRWILVDAQIDAVQRKVFRPKFDLLDVPRDRFVIAGDAWRMCRGGRADENQFGLTQINESGLWFIAQNMLRDLASLNRMEMLPWDSWGSMTEPGVEITAEKAALFDRVAALTMSGDDGFAEVRQIYESNEGLRVPSVVFNASTKARDMIAL